MAVTIDSGRRCTTYTALRALLNRVNDRIGANITWHDLRHTCVCG